MEDYQGLDGRSRSVHDIAGRCGVNQVELSGHRRAIAGLLTSARGNRELEDRISTALVGEIRPIAPQPYPLFTMR